MVKGHMRAPVEAESPATVEAAFYDALQRGDLDALMACWADEDEMVCIHPGGGRQVGVAAIRDAFAALLAEGGLDLQARQVRRLTAPGLAVHSVMERVVVVLDGHPSEAWVVATNVFQLTTRGWRMVAHHASAAPAAEPEAVRAARLLH
ncbi:MAG: nuclear transport factor 2 family protein [Burkholderiaceae bacterium]|jgi:ketosteroid isomerase-like protein|nr:nuclear transport factor 2 family protein [Burkholderiaceae bacterium]